MPAAPGGIVAGGGRLPPLPKARIPVVPTRLASSATPRGVAVRVPPVPRTANAVAAQTLATGSNPRGVAIDHQPSGGINVGSPQYRQSVIDVFNHQPRAVQARIVQAARRTPTPEGRIVLGYVRQNLRAAGAQHGFPMAAITPAGITAPGGEFLQVLKNAASDAWNMPAGTVEGLYGLGKEGVSGAGDLASGNLSGAGQHFGNAFHMLVDPYVQLAEHPLRTFEAHPLNTVMMIAAPESIAGHLIGGAARAGILGDTAAEAASTARAPLSVGTIAGEPADVAAEARDYSGDIFRKALQVSRENYLRARGQNPNIARPAPALMAPVLRQAFNIGQESKLNRVADEMTAVRQMAGRAERARALHDVRKAAPPKEVRGVVSHILQGVVRKPETATEDMLKEINRLKAARTGKRTVDEIANRNQVRDLSTALKHPELLPKAFDAAAQIRPRIKTQDAYLVQKGLLDAEQAARRSVLPYAMAHMGARYDPVEDAFVNPDGTPLPTQAILDHLKENGVPDPAYVEHAIGKVSPSRFYSTYRLARGQLKGGRTTGARFRSGAYDHTFEGLAGQLASRAEAVTRASLHDRVVNRLGVKMPAAMRAGMIRQVFADAKAGKRTVESAREEAALIRRGLFTRDEANRFARAALVDDNGNPIPNGIELTPMSVAPAHVLGAVRDLQHPAELGNISGIELRALAHAVDDARHSTARNVTLIPSVAAKRFADQFAKTDATMRGIGKVTQQFRRTVLPYSTHWMTQIASEAGLRGLIGGALDPRYLRDGRALMKRLEGTEEGRAALMEMVNATFYNAHDPLAVHNPNAGMLSSAAHAFPPTRLLIAMHNRYANSIGSAMYTLEHNARVMGLGKLAHREATAQFGHSWQNTVRLQGHVLDELSRKLTADPALVAKLGRQIDDTFGKYNKFTPRERAAIQSIAPFLPWYLNAAKFVLWHLPAHHPVSAALLTSLRQTVNQDIQDGKGAPLNSYAMQELARLSPFGIFTPDTTHPSLEGALAGDQILGSFLPEAQGSLYNLAGVNSFGENPLTSPAGDVAARTNPAAEAAAENLLESFLPLARYVREVREGGKPSYGTSTILNPQPKPGEGNGGTGRILNRILNPFYSFEEELPNGAPYPYTPKTAGGPANGYLLDGSSSSGGSGYLLGGSSSSGGAGYLLP